MKRDETAGSSFPRRRESIAGYAIGVNKPTVIPAQAGIHTEEVHRILLQTGNLWIPACAGMTLGLLLRIQTPIFILRSVFQTPLNNVPAE